MTDLNDLVQVEFELTITSGSAINSQGQILSRAVLGCRGEPSVAVLLSPLKARVGDINGDCTVDPFDLGLLLGAWGHCTSCTADFNGDDGVDAEDLALLLGNWG